MTRPTPEQIAEIAEHKWDVLEVLALWGYVIIHPDAMRHWWDYSEDAVDPYSLMNWIESQMTSIQPPPTAPITVIREVLPVYDDCPVCGSLYHTEDECPDFEPADHNDLIANG